MLMAHYKLTIIIYYYSFISPLHHIPGKRSCLGEILARQELFLFASALVHEFEIHPPKGQDKIVVSENVGVTNSPSAFEARFIRRQLRVI